VPLQANIGVTGNDGSSGARAEDKRAVDVTGLTPCCRERRLPFGGLAGRGWLVRTRSTGQYLRALVAPLLLVVVVVLAGLGPDAASASTCGSGAGQPLRPGSSDIFFGVAVSSCHAWAVGDYGTGAGRVLTLIERWNGTAWRRQPSLNPGSSYNTFAGVAAASATDAWAVGQASNNAASHAFQTLAEHWNGATWTRVPSPSPGGPAGNNSLDGVAATSASNAWAVGGYDGGPGTAVHTLAEHWNGTAWTQVPTPSPSGSELISVAATSASNAWAVGFYPASAGGNLTLIEHWNGTTWTQAPSPSPGGTRGSVLTGVAAVSATDAWAVGQYFNRTMFQYQTLVEHWNGTAWAQVPSPNPAPARFANRLSSVAATSASNVWAVGDYISNSPGDPDLTLVEHWNGTAWTQVPSPNPSGDNVLYGVAATSASNAWAVGFYSPSGPTLQALAFHCC
jgi:hypothetical protein